MKMKPLVVLVCALGFAAPFGIAADTDAKPAAAEAAAQETVTMTIVSCKGGG